MPSDIETWLQNLSLEKYSDVFVRSEVDLDAVRHLSEDDLKELDLPLGPRKKILVAIEALSEAFDDSAETSNFTQDKVTAREAERRQLTIMFCDLVGSTALSQRLDPEVLRDLMRSYQDAVAQAVSHYDGHIAQFLGDGVLAYFGWPQAHEDQAERAIRAGLDAVAAVQAVRIDSGSLQARVGIATGQVVVGDLVGATGKDAHAVSGETPNLAARLQGIAEPGQVVVGAVTRSLVGKTFALTDLGHHELKGFSSVVPAWSIAGDAAIESRFEASQDGKLTRLIGREHELGLLRSRWEMAKNGEGQALLLSGEAGIGKSRLLQALRDEIGTERYFHLGYQCTPHHTNSVFHPIIQRLERAAGFAPEDDGECRLDKLEALLRTTANDLSVVAAHIAALLSLPYEHRYGKLDLGPQQLRARTIGVLIDQVIALSRQRPVLFVVEDAHWIDPSTEALVGEIMARVDSTALLMLITHRPEYTPPWTGQAHQTAMLLSRLSRRQGAEIVADLGDGLPQKTVEQIVARADGVPLFVEELAKSMFEATNRANQIPETLQASLIARLDRLDEAKAVTQIGAVIGREFSHNLIAAAADLTEAELNGALDRIVASALLFRRGTPPDAAYIFKHALVQDAAYESLLHTRRRDLHRRIATVLIDSFPETVEAEPELLAHHYSEAGDAENACGYWQKAGELAISRFAYQEAVAHLNQAVSSLKSLPETPEFLNIELLLQIQLGTVLGATSGYASEVTERAYLRAQELCERLEDNERLKPVLVGLRQAKHVGGDLQAAQDYGLLCLELANRTEDRVLFAQSNFFIGHTECFLGKFVEAQKRFDQSLDAYSSSQHTAHIRLSGIDPGILALATSAWSQWFLGYPDMAQEASQKAVALAKSFNNPQNLEHALSSAAYTHIRRGEIEAVVASVEAANAISEEQGFKMRAAMAGVYRAWVRSMRNEHDRGVAEMVASISAQYRTGSKASKTQYDCLLSETYFRAKRFDEGIFTLRESLAREAGDCWWDAERQRLLGRFLECGAAPDFALAEAAYKSALEIARGQSAKSWELRAATSLARLWQRQEKLVDARDLLEPVFDWFTEGFDTADLVDAKVLLNELP